MHTVKCNSNRHNSAMGGLRLDLQGRLRERTYATQCKREALVISVRKNIACSVAREEREDTRKLELRKSFQLNIIFDCGYGELLLYLL